MSLWIRAPIYQRFRTIFLEHFSKRSRNFEGQRHIICIIWSCAINSLTVNCPNSSNHVYISQRPKWNENPQPRYAHLYPTRTAGTLNALRHRMPDLLLEFPTYLMEKKKCAPTVIGYLLFIKSLWFSSYSCECTQMNCFMCQCNS